MPALNGIHAELAGSHSPYRWIKISCGALSGVMLLSVLLQRPIASRESLSNFDHWAPLLIAVISFAILALINRSESRYLRHASQLLEQIEPVERELEASFVLEANRSTARQLTCRLYPPDQNSNEAPIESFTVLRPPWCVPDRFHESVQVYYDPTPGGPIVICTSRGLLLKSPVSMLTRRKREVLEG